MHLCLLNQNDTTDWPAFVKHRAVGNYVVYLLVNKKKNQTYIGSSNHLLHRVRQHRREIKGGARKTSGWSHRPQVLAFVSGFATHSQALSFEWHAKRASGNSKSLVPPADWNDIRTFARAQPYAQHRRRVLHLANPIWQNPKFAGLDMTLHLCV
jgi:predicted GIY-YIG superfamily endonuclease